MPPTSDQQTGNNKQTHDNNAAQQPVGFSPTNDQSSPSPGSGPLIKARSKLSGWRMIIFIAIFAIAGGISLLLLFAASPSSPSKSSQKAAYFQDCTILDNSDQSNAIRDYVAQQLHAAGVQWVRLEIQWRELEPRGPGQYNQNYLTTLDYCIKSLRQNDIQVFGMVFTTPKWAADPGGVNRDNCNGYGGAGFPDSYIGVNCPPEDVSTYGNIMHFLADRYKTDISDTSSSQAAHGRVGAWEIWNEVNDYQYWQTQNNNTYLSLLKAAHDQIKAVDPSILVIMGGSAPSGNNGKDTPQWFKDMYAINNGEVANYMDVVAMHPYEIYGGYTDVVPAVHRIMKQYGDRNKPIWFTEWGVGRDTKPGFAQADYLQTAYKNISKHYSYVGVMAWFNTDEYFDCQTTDAGFCSYTLLGSAPNHRDLTPNPIYCGMMYYPNSVPHDNTPPTVPTNVQAGQSGTTVTLKWDTSFDSGGCGMDGYKVYRDYDPTKKNNFVVNTTSISYTDTSPGAGKHTYQVFAYDNAGNTSQPVSINVTVP